MILNTAYFGSVDWFKQIACAKESTVYIEAHENYVKQTERNRCIIATASGTQNLSVPVTLPTSKCKITEVLVSDHGNWRHQHWEALKSAYGMSPFFDFYIDDVQPFFENRWETLFDFNLSISRKMLSLLGVDKELRITESYQGKQEKKPDSTLRYYQTFQRRNGFIPGLSILDLLFNEGPEAILFLKRPVQLI